MLNRQSVLSTGKTKLGRGITTLRSSQKERALDTTQPLKKSQCSLSTKTSKLGRGQSKAGSTRLVGDRSEAGAKHILEGHKFLVAETRNSGATNFDGDMVVHLPNENPSDPSSTYLRTECKFKSTTGFSISKEHWTRIKEKSLMHGGIPAYIFENKDHHYFLTITLKDFSSLVENIWQSSQNTKR